MWILLALVVMAAVFFWPTRARRARARLAAARQAAEARDWTVFTKELGLALAAAEGIGNKPIREQTLGEIQLMRAWGAHRQGDLDEAAGAAEKAIGHIEQSAAVNRDSELVNARHLWGEVETDRGDLEAAAAQFRAAAHSVEFGKKPELAIFSLQRLGDALLAQERFGEAREVIGRCLQFERRALADGAGETAESLRSMYEPDFALASENYEQAEALLREKLEHWSSAAPVPGEMTVTRDHFHLALALQKQGKFAAALEALSYAVEMTEAQWGPEHPRASGARRMYDEALRLTAREQATPLQPIQE